MFLLSTFWHFLIKAQKVVLGTVVTRGPRSPLAQSAMAELDQACILFTKASECSIRAAKALVGPSSLPRGRLAHKLQPILIRLSEKARYALASAQSNPAPTSGDKGGLLWNIKQEDTEDELAILSGRTRFVSSRKGGDSTMSTPPHSVRFESSPPPLYPSQNRSSPSSDIRQEPDHHQPSSMFSSGYARMMPIDEIPTSVMSDGWSTAGPSRAPEQYVPANSLNFGYEQRKGNSQTIPSAYEWRNTGDRNAQLPQNEVYQQQHSITSTPAQHTPSQQRQYEVPSQAGHIPPHYPPYTSQSQLPPQHPVHTQHYLDPSRAPIQSSAHFEHYPIYGAAGYQGLNQNTNQPPSPNVMALADLGLASRDSRLDERWGSFMADSGLLEDFERR